MKTPSMYLASEKIFTSTTDLYFNTLIKMSPCTIEKFCNEIPTADHFCMYLILEGMEKSHYINILRYEPNALILDEYDILSMRFSGLWKTFKNKK